MSEIPLRSSITESAHEGSRPDSSAPQRQNANSANNSNEQIDASNERNIAASREPVDLNATNTLAPPGILILFYSNVSFLKN